MQFAAIMETLGNEALGKMMNVVDEAELLVELESPSRRAQTSFLNVLRNAHVGMAFTLTVAAFVAVFSCHLVFGEC